MWEDPKLTEMQMSTERPSSERSAGKVCRESSLKLDLPTRERQFTCIFPFYPHTPPPLPSLDLTACDRIYPPGCWYLDVGVLHPGRRVGRGSIGFALVIEDGECLLAGATGPRQGQAFHHGEAYRGIHMDSTSPWDPASAQPVCLAPWTLHVAHLIGAHAMLFLVQAA